jgi:hypothetical protein
VNQEDFIKLEREIINGAIELAVGKRLSYASADDVLSNFKVQGERTGLTKYQVWLNFSEKHILSIENAIKTTPESPQDPSESLRGRILDLINYLTLFAGLLEEDGLL